MATRHGCKVFIVSNGGLRLSQNPLIETIFVADRPDAADMWIAERAGPGDVVVTGDIQLAPKCLAAGARVLQHDGKSLSSANIGNVLAGHDLMTELRAADPFRHDRGRPFSKADRSRFLDALERAVQVAKRS